VAVRRGPAVSPTIVSHDEPRAWGPPVFRVDPAGQAGWAVEVARSPELLDTARHAAERQPDINFFASWEAGLSTGDSFVLPTTAWTGLRDAPRLFYRLHSSSSLARWQDHQVTTEDADAVNAPFICVFDALTHPDQPFTRADLEPVWVAGRGEPAFLRVCGRGLHEVVFYRHQFQPGHPIDPQSVEWVLAGSSRLVDGLASVAVVRVDFVRRVVLAAAVRDFGPQPVDAGQAAVAASTAGLPGAPPGWQPAPSAMQRVGDVWIFSNLGPSPTTVGGTVIVHAVTGQVVYAAGTASGAALPAGGTPAVRMLA
jgi:hypothetical protein